MDQNSQSPDSQACAGPLAAPPALPLAGQLVRDLPKVELHVHLEGSMPAETLFELARRHRVAGIPDTLEELREWYAFTDFPHFVEVYLASVRTLRDEADFALLTSVVAERLAAQNVRYAEVHVSLYAHLMRGVPAKVVFDGIEQARREAEREHGIQLRWIPDFPADFGVQTAEETVEAVLRDGPPSVVGFGVGGVETPLGQYAEVFGRARAAGLASLPHAGEQAGPERVREALDLLGAERIGHGIDTMKDPDLLERLVDAQVPVDVSPTSNICTRVVDRIEDHPLPAMLDSGLLVTLNSDDPTLFGSDLTGEYEIAYDLVGPDGLVRLARNGVHASYLGAARRRELLAEIDAVAARHGL
ncbi:adenosine deaminase [Nocardiopsis metallicus]|uniref:Aminodeoxyfutalosine deaminase n=1 Tax=Nocardiopsis metallicus TaxID=179819 RepID=A0A840WC96_9ACTN|nr:adenosine deaminase [Nocardiopsis metallicus]MBB5493764.1 aminodeoxyfutalosine deaminase [Nocardiopsis metallicus]